MLEKRGRQLRTLSLTTLILLLIGMLAWQISPSSSAQSSKGDGQPNQLLADGHTVVGHSVDHDESPAVRDITPVASKPKAESEANINPKTRSKHDNEADTVVQSVLAPLAMPGPILNFDGIGFPGVNCNCAPPDTNGEVGLTQYVQTVNNGFQVWNKVTGVSVLGPLDIATIWSGFGGSCEFYGHGDPVVLYDQLADRWLISQFAGSPVVTNECVAISSTADATGSYYRYDFNLGSNFYDYPHIGVWPDGYYMSMNVFNPAGTAYLGPQPFVFDRARMLQGLSATFISPVGPLGGDVDPFLPADLDGSTLPPAGAPNTFVTFPGTTGVYDSYHFHADFTTPANSTFTAVASPAAAPFTMICTTTRACVPQLGVTAANNIDAIGDRLMFRLAYRNFGDHESLVGNYTVSSNSVAGVRWFELRNVTAGPITLYQESTYQPDTTWRFMGSAAMDGAGNLAVGFSASSATINPQIRYAGRLASDPLNTLAQGEATLFAGTGSQSGSGNRWGDYSDLTVDPVDDCTFWYTNEYYATTTTFAWKTRIGSFTMPAGACTAATPTPTATGTPATATPTFSPTIAPTATATACGGVYPWTAAAVVPGPILDHAAAALGSNVYIFGGVGSGAYSTAARKYDTVNNVWTSLTAYPVSREGPVAVSDGTQYIYIAGGTTGTAQLTMHRYDTVANSYTAMATAPAGTGAWAEAAAYIGGKIYVIGGTNTAGTATAFNRIYTVSTNTWTTGAVLPAAQGFASAMAMNIGGVDYVYVAGGTGPGLNTYRYNTATNIWEDAPIADLPAPRFGAASGIVNGKWVLAGGYVSGSPSASAISWDPNTNVWTSLPPMLQPRGRLAGASVGTALYAIGGRTDATFTGTNDNQRYIPSVCPTATSTSAATSTNTPVPTATDTATAVATDTATSTPVDTATSTPVDTSTSTATNTPVDTSTSTATNTPVNTATSTPVDTSTSTATSTPVDTATSTPVDTATTTATSTATSVPGTATNTPLPTEQVFWINQVKVTASGNTITKSTVPAAWDAGAASGRQIASGDGFVQATVNSTSTYTMFGLGQGDTNVDYTDINYAIYTYSYTGQLAVYENGVYRGNFNTYNVGDVLKVGVVGGVVKYYQNGVVFYTSTVVPSYPLLLDASIWSPGGQVSNAIIGGANLSTVTPWTPTATATATNTAVPVVASAVTWINQVNVTASGNSITKTAGANAWDAGAASSLQFPAGDGYAEATVADTTRYVMFGLNNGDTTPNYTDIDFAIYTYASTGQLAVYENGAYKGNFVSYATGDVLRVAVVSGAVKYSKNGVVFYTSAVAPSYPLLLDASIASIGGQVSNAFIAGANLTAVTPWTPTPSPTATSTAVAVTCAPVVYSNPVNVNVSANNITKSAGGDAWNAGAISSQLINSGDGSVSATVADTLSYAMVGLGTGNNNGNYTTIRYAIYTYASIGQLAIYENGAYKATGPTYTTGDVLKVAVESGVVKYSKNGVAFYTSAVVPSYPLRLNTAIFTLGASINNAQVCGLNVSSAPVVAGKNIPADQLPAAPKAPGAVPAQPVVPSTVTAPAEPVVPSGTNWGVPDRPVVPQGTSFVDVPADFWAAAAIRWATINLPLSGYDGATGREFRPYQQATRGQVVKLLVVAAGYEVASNITSQRFNDVDRSNPFYAYIETAVAHNLITGYADGSFRPNQQLTRAQMSKLVAIAAGWTLSTPGSVAFSDVAASDWAAAYIATVAAHGVVSGYADGTFQPNAPITRAQMAKMLFNGFAQQ